MDPTRLVLGSGEVYFDRFSPGTREGTGEIYVGNTPAFTIERKVGFSGAKKSSGGVLQRSHKTVTEDETLVTFTTDNISDNVTSWWYGADYATHTRTGLAAQSETFVLVPGRFYQLGLAIMPPIGINDAFGISIKVGTEFITDICYVDAPNGRFGLPLSRTDLTGQTATVEYEIRWSTRFQMSPTPASIKNGVRGAMRYVSKNRVGASGNIFFPHVLLAPRDQRQYKSAEWGAFTFEGEALAAPMFYGRRNVSTSPGEQALINEGINPAGFVVIEGVLSDIMGG